MRSRITGRNRGITEAAMYTYDGEFKGRTFLITGSGKGIGSGMAIAAGEAGANVVVHYNTSAQSAEEVFRKVQATGCPCVLVRSDLSEPDGPARLYEAAVTAFGGVDVLVNNAALEYHKNFDGYDTETIRHLFRVNLRGYTMMSHLVMPGMKERGFGRIINISSVHAKRPLTFDAGYGMTKGAIKMLTRELAVELGNYPDITANAIELGSANNGVKTGNPGMPMSREDFTLPPLFQYRTFPGWKRRLEPEEIAPAVLFLASEAARHICGAALRIDDAAMMV